MPAPRLHLAKLMLTAAAVVIAFRAPMTRGANVMQIANDALGASSFTGATNWNPAGAPVAGNTYQSGFIFRTPSQSGNPAPFAGNSLEMLNGSEFRDKTGGTVTVGNLILDNTAIVSLTQPNNVNSATNTGTLAGSITVAFGATAVFLAGEQADTTGDTFTIAATISGTGGFTTAGTGAIANSRGAIILTASNSFTGVTTVQSASVGTLQLGNADAVRDSAVTIGTANTLTFSAGLGAFNLGGLAGSVNETLMDMAAAPVTLNVGLNNGVSTVYSGNLSGSGAVLDKIGGNTLTLSGANTYTGGTTVSGGTLMVNGSLATGVIIASGATLGGNGTISGAVTNKVGGALHPGLGGTDTSTLFINNNLTLAGNTQFTLDRTNAQNASQIAGLATLTQGGGLIVNNAGPALQAGDTFTLFTAVNYTGSFSSINLPALASGLFWSNTIPINGAITVLSTNPELTPQLQHRYNFTSNANDLIGTANGTLPNGGTFGGGQLTFSSTNQQYLSLPGGIIDSNYPAVTIDMWATIQTGLPAFCYLFCIGDTDTNTDGYDYIFLNPQFARVTISAADPGFNGEQGGDFTTLAGANNLHITSVFNPPAGVISVYTNGVLSATFTGITDPLSVVGSQFTYVGRSLYNDSFFNWSISELRIYNIALSPLEIAAGDASGADSPNTNFGTVTNLQLQLPASQLALGGAESATVFAQTTLITNLANVTAYCTYLSGNTAVLTVDTNGLVTAVGPGSTTISARFANATATQTVTVPSASALLLHRYSFTSDASDSVGNANGTLQGNAAISGGAVVLDGVNSYVNLPGGLISSLGDVTFETWVTQATATAWGRVFDFGNNTGGAGGQGTGLTYVFMTPDAGGTGALRFSYTENGNGAESPVLNGPVIANNQPYFLAVVYSPSENFSGLYVNGSLVVSSTATGPLSAISDVNDWLGKSQFNDPYFAGSIDEFRIWGGALTAGQIALDYSNGPNTVVVLPPTNAVIANLPATGVLANSASLNGQVVSTGNQVPAVTIYYGPADGGTNAGAWADSVALGGKTAAFSAAVSGLATNTTYYYTAFASNSAGISWATPSVSFATLATNPVATRVQMVTYHYDNTRQGLNSNETLLMLGNVNSTSFGKLFSYALDGYIYTEPLIMTNLTIPGQGVHDVVFVASEHDTVYALDADSKSGTNGGVLWTNNLGNYALSASATFGDRYTGGGYTDILPDVGITGTPVIDPASGTLYVDAFTLESSNYIHRLHALDVTTGKERTNSPVVVTASVPGVGRDSTNGVLTFNPMQSNQRGALTLANGVVYVIYAGYADTDPYHGWVIGYNATNLTEVSAFCTTPNASVAAFGAHAAEGGIWQGGNGMCVDSNNNLYFETGNGSFQNTNALGPDYADSFMKLSTSNGLVVTDYFTPFDQLTLANDDLDLSSCGPMLLPDAAGSTNHPHLIVGTGKSGTIYLLDRDNMGEYNTGGNNSQIVQSVVGQLSTIWSSPVYFNGLIFCQASGSVMRSFTLTNGTLGTTPASSATVSYGQFNGGPVISANGTNNGIAWVIDGAVFGSSGPDILYAYNATNLSQILYDSSQNLTRDNPGGAMKMTTPTVSGGKVYVGAQFQLSVYGVQVFLNTPVIAPDGGAFTNAVTVSLTDGSPGVSIYYTLNGSTPTSSSTLYTNAFILTSNAVVSAIAIQAGAVNSGVVTASFVNTAAAGDGTGLLGQYYPDTFPTNAFTGTPLVRTDAVINFAWGNSAPFAGVGSSNYTVKWTGSLQPQFNENYTLTTVAAGGVRLYVNGQLLINGWTNPVATNRASVALAAQELYTVELDYYQSNGNAGVALEWSSPSTPQAVVPETQLYPYTNPPPTVLLTEPSTNAVYSGTASVTVSAEADAPYNPINGVSFYANNSLLGTVSNAPYTLTATGLGTGSYALSAVAVDGSGLSSTSAVVNITVTGGSGQPYGLATNGNVPAFFNLPTTFNGTLPLVLSQTGVFSNTPAMAPVGGLIPYVPNTPLWSDGALKTRYLAVPNNGGVITPGQQITFAPTGTWTFPAGTVFVKTFSLNTDLRNAGVVQRLETRLLVRDINGRVYGVTYKWRADDSDADLLTNSLTENVVITNATGGTNVQTWYYPSPADCLTCHAGVNNDYVLGVNTRQLNASQLYPSTGVTDNELRTLNRLGLLNPAINEGTISNYAQLSALTNLSASLQERSRSYLDANCAQCHQPGGTGITFDARYDTPLTNQNLINVPASVTLGYDHAEIIAPEDVWRSVIWDRINVVDGTNATKIQMPPLARNVIDTNAVAVLGAWINSLSAPQPAEAPPVLAPNGGNFIGQVKVTVVPPDTNAVIYYTLDGSLPTTNSPRYAGPIELTNGAVTVSANAWEGGYVNSVAASGLFVVQPLYFASEGFTNHAFAFEFAGAAGSNYVLEATADFKTWAPLATNVASSSVFTLMDTNAASFPMRFYRVIQQ